MMLDIVNDEICKAFAILRWGTLLLKYSTIFLRTLSQIGAHIFSSLLPPANFFWDL